MSSIEKIRSIFRKIKEDYTEYFEDRLGLFPINR